MSIFDTNKNAKNDSQGSPEGDSLPIAYSGEVMLLKWSDTSNQGRTITLRLPDDDPDHPFRRMATNSGKQAGQRFMAVFVKLDDQEKPDASAAQKPYGKHARVLYSRGWMYNKRVLRACGSVEEYAQWVATQPCVICKSAGPSSVLGGSEDYLKLPVCNLHIHTDISAIYSRNPKQMQQWVSEVISKKAGVDSLGHITPVVFKSVVKELGIEDTVPDDYYNPDPL